MACAPSIRLGCRTRNAVCGGDWLTLAAKSTFLFFSAGLSLAADAHEMSKIHTTNHAYNYRQFTDMICVSILIYYVCTCVLPHAYTYTRVNTYEA